MQQNLEDINILDEALDGKTLSMLLKWQRGQSPDNDDTMKSIEPTSFHTLNVPTALQEIHYVNINPSMSEPDFETQIDTS